MIQGRGEANKGSLASLVLQEILPPEGHGGWSIYTSTGKSLFGGCLWGRQVVSSPAFPAHLLQGQSGLPEGWLGKIGPWAQRYRCWYVEIYWAYLKGLRDTHVVLTGSAIVAKFNSFIHSFTHQIFIELILCSWHCPAYKSLLHTKASWLLLEHAKYTPLPQDLPT